MERVQKYLTEYVDDEAEIRSCTDEVTDRLSLFLKNTFEYYEMRILNENVLLLRPMQKETLYRMQSWMRQVEEACGMKTVLLLNEATPYMIKKMLKDRTAFVVPGKQISLPFMVTAIRTEKKKSSRTVMRFSPAAQMIFLYLLYSDGSVFTAEKIASALDMSRMSAQRGLTEIEESGLLSHETGGRTGRKKLYKRDRKSEFFAEGKSYLSNPVRDVVYVRSMPKSAEFVVSDLSALAEQTMLGEPEQRHYAIYSRRRSCLEGCIVSEEEAMEENLPAVQLMKYDVCRLSRNGLIDPVSMLCSLSENDERIQMSVEELMSGYEWYTGENEKW